MATITISYPNSPGRGWAVEYVDNEAVGMFYVPAAEGPPRPPWPSRCPSHNPIHSDCDDCYRWVKGWPRR